MEVHEKEVSQDTATATSTAVVEGVVEEEEEQMVVADNEPAVATATKAAAAASEKQPRADEEEKEEQEEEDMYVGASLRALFNLLPANGGQGQGEAGDLVAVEGDDSQWLQDEVSN